MDWFSFPLLAYVNIMLKSDITAAQMTAVVEGVAEMLKSELAKGRSSAAVKAFSKIGADILDLAYKNQKPKVAQHLATAAIDLLCGAIRKGRKDMAKALAEIFVEGLLQPKKNEEYEPHVNKLVEDRVEMFNQALRNEKQGKRVQGPTADEWVEVIMLLLTASIGLQHERTGSEYSEMAHYFSACIVKALKEGIQDGCEDRVANLVAGRTAEFREAMKTQWEHGQVQEAEILSEAAFEVLSRGFEEAPTARNSGGGGLAKMFAQSWADALDGALSGNRARVEAVVARTLAFKEGCGQDGKDGRDFAARAGVATAVLLAAVKKESVDLILVLSRSWVTAFVVVGHDRGVAGLVKQKTKEFNGAITGHDTEQAKILLQFAIAILLAAVEMAQEGVPILTSHWVQGLGKVVQRNKAETVEAFKEAVNFAEMLLEGPNGFNLQTLEDARSAILSEAEDHHEGVVDLVDEAWPAP